MCSPVSDGCTHGNANRGTRRFSDPARCPAVDELDGVRESRAESGSGLGDPLGRLRHGAQAFIRGADRNGDADVDDLGEVIDEDDPPAAMHPGTPKRPGSS
ncbi:hypothetical protein GCM10025867_19320 [Frondihabitans sucicola]|uniref:Uncharacterized protein n=1 Tax=Frondihabitans sucicola TaxID=1268041 RepID=A0ABN6XXP6_9MICO|nr:hypothetical protein GCM10025867_19320 [Frondihabitans sucicola]